MTEYEAKLHICHRTIGLLAGGQVYCIAHRCMAWRWHEARRTAAFLEAVQAHMKTQAKPNFSTATQAVYAENGGQYEMTEGYCGLAGVQP